MTATVQPVIMTADLNRLLAFYTELLGAVQTSRVPDEGDTSGSFRHGGLSQLFFDHDAMGQTIGRRTYQVSAEAWRTRSGDPITLGGGKRLFPDDGELRNFYCGGCGPADQHGCLLVLIDQSTEPW
jgi:catechol 2,3-dioxygenase-like lactoylglutathione lyase family enzyme